MDQIFIDIREQNESIRKELGDKDLVSVESLLDTMDDLIWQIGELKDKIEELEHPEDNEPGFMEKWKEAKENGWL